MSHDRAFQPLDTAAQSAFLANLRHELRTPMNAIIGYSEMLLEELEETNLKDDLQQIHTCSQQLLYLINTILNPVKLEENSGDLNEFSHTIQAEFLTPLNVVIAHCERLLEEAVPELIPDLTKIHTAAQSLLILINENVNFSQEQLTADNSSQIPTNLPLSSTASTMQEVANTIRSLEEKSDRPSVSYQGKILVVDDNGMNCDLLSRQLERQGYATATATNGQKALEKLRTESYDLILLDIIMPQMNGYQVLQHLKSHEQWRYIPVVMISALDEIDSVVKCIEMGAEDYLPKPFNPVLLQARVGASLEKKRLRDQEVQYLEQLAAANRKIVKLNESLKAENLRLNAELNIARKLQQMMLPKDQELAQIDELEIAGFMEPAAEVGGDYYDVLTRNGQIKIGIGDVCGHGLESGVLVIMVQTAIRTLLESNLTDPHQFLQVLNRVIYDNVQRMDSTKILTLTLLDYQNRTLCCSGQHEEIIVARTNGQVERLDTIDLGFWVGLEPNIEPFIDQAQIHLNPGDVVVLYTDGVTEARNSAGLLYGLERLCNVVQQHCHRSAQDIRQLVIEDVRRHIGSHCVCDDLTLLVLKQRT